MIFLLIIVFFFITLAYLVIYVEEYNNRKHDAALDNSKKRWKLQMTIRYRVYITHATGSVRVRTVSGETFSEAMDDAFELAAKEENSFPDKMIIKEDIIYI